jgi:hypothetical protein
MKATADYSSQAHPAGAFGDVFLDTVSLPNAPEVRLALLSARLSGLSSRPVISCTEASKNATFQPDFPALPGFLGLNTGRIKGSLMFEHGLEDFADDSFIDALVKAGMRGVFATQLCASGGFLWLGGYDRDHIAARQVPQYASRFHYISEQAAYPASRPYFVRVSGFSIGRGPVLPTANISGNIAMVDTGNRFLQLPSMALADLKEQLEHDLANARARGYDWTEAPDQATCLLGLPQDGKDLDTLLPDLTIYLYNTKVTVATLAMSASQSYMVAYPGEGGQTMWCMEVDNAGLDSVGGIGLPVLRNFITIFDTERDMIGFAPPDPRWCDSAAPPPPAQPAPPPGPASHWRLHVLLAACACAAALAAAAFAVVRYRRAAYHDLTTLDSQEGHPLDTPLLEQGALN